MSFFGDLFGGGYQDAAKAQEQALNTAYQTATPFYGQARGNITDYGAKALEPYTKLSDIAGAGTTALGGLLGLGPGGASDIQRTLQNLPGYQFTLGQGEQAVDRGAAARSGGNIFSGNTLAAEQAYAQGLANQYYGNYVSQLKPYLDLASTAAGGVSGVNTGIGGNLANINLNQGQLGYNTEVGIGNAQAAAATAAQNAQNSFINGLVQAGGKILGGYLGAKG
jgi:hypothetical protein